VVDNPLVLKIVNVVPRLVEQRAAPAAKAWMGVAPTRGRRTKDKAMGKDIPVSATAIDRERFVFNAVKLVDSPPISIIIMVFGWGLRGKCLHKQVISTPDILTERLYFEYWGQAISHLGFPMLHQ
jgi:hypothetical protein